jgi:hypothetical protein
MYEQHILVLVVRLFSHFTENLGVIYLQKVTKEFIGGVRNPLFHSWILWNLGFLFLIFMMANVMAKFFFMAAIFDHFKRPVDKHNHWDNSCKIYET